MTLIVRFLTVKILSSEEIIHLELKSLCSTDKERSSPKSRPQDERAKRAEPLVTVDHNFVLEPVRLHSTLLCEDKHGAPI